ncbi:MAG: radical SAM protein, partial [Deltaproteobacteria bacterium]|nr:radical SAM protein [Deltaproteobacteria bacterium]
VPKPFPLKNIQRPYSRYGISFELFQKELSKIQNPKAILVTSLMTYWYPGVEEVIGLSRKMHPNVPVILGGIYARLCHNHAVQNSGADLVATNHKLDSLLEILDGYGISTPGDPPDPDRPYKPAFDLLTRPEYICILTSTGCPYRCRYCASHFLNPELIRRDPGEVLEEILHWHRNFNVRDFAFYDDALLVSSDTHLAPLLEELARLELDLRFHTPNALHIKEITPDIASLMHQTGFRTIRLGLETSDFSIHRYLDNKVTEGDFERAVNSLLKAGFAKNQIGAYVLMGLPGQSVDSVFESIDFVGKTGATPYLAEYSPIPHTPMWEQAVNHSQYDLVEEPLFHNNTLLPCWDDSRIKELPRLKKSVLEIRRKYR